MTAAEAEALAAAALLWIAGNRARVDAMLAASGLAPGDLRARVDDPAFLGFVLDHVLSDEAAVVAFARETGCRPDAVLRARAALPGGDAPDWT